MSRVPMCGIYALVNEITGESYIGSSIDIIQRFHAHRSLMSRGKHLPRIRKAIEEYGLDVFAFVILEECEPDIRYEREQFWFDSWHPEYNAMSQAVPNNHGLTMPIETKEMMSRAQMGNKKALGYQNNLGTKFSEESKARLSEIRRLEWARRKANVLA